MNYKAKSSRKGFTLVEILIAVAALGLLAAFTIPKLRNVFSKTQSTGYVHNAKEVNDILETFEGLGGTFGTTTQGTITATGVLSSTDPLTDLTTGGGVYANGQLLGLAGPVDVGSLAFSSTTHRYQ